MSLICKSSLQNVAQSHLPSPRCCSSNLKQSAVALVRLTAAGRGRMELGAVLQRDVQTHHRTHHTEPQQHIVHWPAHTHTDTHTHMYESSFSKKQRKQQLHQKENCKESRCTESTPSVSSNFYILGQQRNQIFTRF